MWFNYDDGCGCIVNQLGEKVLVHYRDIQSDGHKTLAPNRTVSYVEMQDEKGGLFAIDVHQEIKKPVMVAQFNTPITLKMLIALGIYCFIFAGFYIVNHS